MGRHCSLEVAATNSAEHPQSNASTIADTSSAVVRPHGEPSMSDVSVNAH